MKRYKETMKKKVENFSPTAVGVVIGELAATAAAGIRNATSREACPSTTPLLGDIMEELRSGNSNIIGVLGPNLRINANLVEKVVRRSKNEELFDVVVMTTVSNKPDYIKIQDELAKALEFTFYDENIGGTSNRGIRWLSTVFGLENNKLNDEIESRARTLVPRMLLKHRILVILCDLCSKGVDLDKAGIPYGAYHTGCKLLLTSASKDVLSNHMNVQKLFIV